MALPCACRNDLMDFFKNGMPRIYVDALRTSSSGDHHFMRCFVTTILHDFVEQPALRFSLSSSVENHTTGDREWYFTCVHHQVVDLCISERFLVACLFKKLIGRGTEVDKIFDENRIHQCTSVSSQIDAWPCLKFVTYTGCETCDLGKFFCLNDL